MLGIGKPGIRLLVRDCGTPKCIQEIMEIMGVMEVVGKNKVKILAVHSMPTADDEQSELILHLDNADSAKIIKVLADRGYKAEIRER